MFFVHLFVSKLERSYIDLVHQEKDAHCYQKGLLEIFEWRADQKHELNIKNSLKMLLNINYFRTEGAFTLGGLFHNL